jgi:hypothetical protein
MPAIIPIKAQRFGAKSTIKTTTMRMLDPKAFNWSKYPYREAVIFIEKLNLSIIKKSLLGKNHLHRFSLKHLS